MILETLNDWVQTHPRRNRFFTVQYESKNTVRVTVTEQTNSVKYGRRKRFLVLLLGLLGPEAGETMAQILTRELERLEKVKW